jgi:hypothetical protein
MTNPNYLSFLDGVLLVPQFLRRFKKKMFFPFDPILNYTIQENGNIGFLLSTQNTQAL